jgi:HD superfamily phosphohydrolase
MRTIQRHIQVNQLFFNSTQAHVALAAALVHDLGHGMFSHAFESIGKKLGLKMAHHETVSDALIREGPVSVELKQLGSGFANDVADVIKSGRPGNLYDAVVSSQFDADRLDYVQRDSLMTGVQSSGIDFTWLMANLEIGEVATGVDDRALGKVPTFVLGPKAFYAAETYVLALFQLYPTVYLHKTTRGAEKLFVTLMIQLISLVRDGHVEKTGLPANHPIISFAKDPESLDNALALDDTVFWGAVQMLSEASDKILSECATRLRDRRFLKCVDIRNRLISEIAPRDLSSSAGRDDLKVKLERLIPSIDEQLQQWSEQRSDGLPRILTDYAVRDPYKRFQDSKGPLNQIQMRTTDGNIRDMAEVSSVVAGMQTHELFRAYINADDSEARAAVEAITNCELER